MNYPESRLRRLRHNKIIRKMFEDIKIFPQDLIYPIFVCEGKNIKNEINSLEGQFQISIDNVIKLCKKLIDLKINKILLFGVVSKKDISGEISCNSKSIIPQAISKIKEIFGNDILIIADICNCSYTTHGHCGTIKDNDVDNDTTTVTLANQSLVVARSGADVIAPSDMMDGRVKIIREKLDQNGYEKVPIFPYSIKYSSSFYGPFREAVNSDFSDGKRDTYQMNFKNSYEFIREIEQDLNEGSDAVIIKPALSYLDIINRVKNKFNVPIIAYNVSGEYSMVKSSAKNNHINEIEVILEIMHSIKRAGADSIITYHAIQIAKYFKDNNV
jgi:porphobilinogen synthase|tara:strand:+ start:1834 stop:2820 length:987 start_codon:yes stop_codon:yes gene_type:complete